MILILFFISIVPGLALTINQTIEEDDQGLRTRDYYIPEDNPYPDAKYLKDDN